MHPILRASLALLILVAAVPPSSAAAHRDIDDRLNISLGAFKPDLGIRAQVNSTTVGLGTSINFDDTFNLGNRESVPVLAGYFRFNPKHRIDFDLFGVDKEGTAVAQNEFEYEDIMIEPGDSLTARNEYTFFGVYYSYALVNSGPIEAGIRAGLSFLDFDLNLVTNIGDVTEERADEAALLPLPIVGFYASHTLRPKLFFDYDLNLFALSYEEYSGSMTRLRLLVNWYPLKHFGFGGGLANYTLDVDVAPEGEDFTGNLDLSYTGYDFHLSFLWGQP